MMTEFWNDKKVIITGGAGFLGSYILEKLEKTGCEVFVSRSKDYDLTTEAGVEKMFKDAPAADLLIHLAAIVGGIGANREHPGSFCYKNGIMGLLLVEHARRNNAGKFVGVGTICSYPKHTPVPFKEEDLWNGYPEETNAPYGLAKKLTLVQLQGYRQEFGMNGIYLMPVNLYGPRDNFDLQSSHVIPALIRKIETAMTEQKDTVTCWGDGSASREFLFARDAAEGILLAAEHYKGTEPVNLGSGREITIKDLVTTIAQLMGYQGTIEWDTSKPNGQPRRCLDTTRAKEYFGFEAKTSLEDGLRETIDWYRKNREATIK